MTTPHPFVDRARGLAALVRRRFADRAHTRENGDLMIDAMIAAFIVSITAAFFLSNAAASNAAQRRSLGTDVVSQQAQGVLERAQGQSWAALGFATTQSGYRIADARGRATVLAASTSSDPAKALQPLTTGIVTRGVTMSQRVDISWDNSLPSSTAPGAYGTKVITVTIAYTYPGSTVEQTKTYVAKRTSTIAEAIPATLSSVSASTVNPVDPLPRPCPAVTTSGRTATWTAVRGAKQYHVTYSGTSSGDVTVTGTSYTAPGTGAATFRVLAVWADGWESSGC